MFFKLWYIYICIYIYIHDWRSTERQFHINWSTELFSSGQDQTHQRDPEVAHLVWKHSDVAPWKTHMETGVLNHGHGGSPIARWWWFIEKGQLKWMIFGGTPHFMETPMWVECSMSCQVKWQSWRWMMNDAERCWCIADSAGCHQSRIFR